MSWLWEILMIIKIPYKTYGHPNNIFLWCWIRLLAIGSEPNAWEAQC